MGKLTYSIVVNNFKNLCFPVSGLFFTFFYFITPLIFLLALVNSKCYSIPGYDKWAGAHSSPFKTIAILEYNINCGLILFVTRTI